MEEINAVSGRFVIIQQTTLVQSTPLHRVTLVSGYFDPINQRDLFTDFQDILYLLPLNPSKFLPN